MFVAGFVAGAVVASVIVSWKWNRDYEYLQTVQLAGQAHVATEIYAGRSEELAESILGELPGYLDDVDRHHLGPPSTPLVANWVQRAYEESGQAMPTSAREILDRWSSARN